MFIDVPVDDAGLKLSGGTSNGRSVAIQPNRVHIGLSSFLLSDASPLICRLVECFAFLCSQPADHAFTLVSSCLYSSVFLSRFVLGLLLSLVRCGLMPRMLTVVDDLPLIVGYEIAHVHHFFT